MKHRFSKACRHRQKPTHPVRLFLGKFWGLSAWMLELIMILSAVLRKYPDLAVVSTLLVPRLSATEDAATMDVLCVDKSGSPMP